MAVIVAAGVCMWALVKTQKRRKHENTSLVGLRQNLSTSLGLTFAGVDALRPHVISVSIAGTSTILIPSTARSATTDSACFLKRTALGARHLIARGDG